MKRSWPKWANKKRILGIAKFRNKGYNQQISRSEWEIKPILLNRRFISRVVIDPHFEVKHSESITNELILELVKLLDGKHERHIGESGGFRYYHKLLKLRERQYRLVWLLVDEEDYVGVINAYRDDREF